MQFESLFLEKTAQLKFALLRLLNSNATEHMTIADLSTKMNLSYQQTYNLFQELLSDCKALSPLKATALRKAFITGKAPIGLDTYRLYLFRSAIAFEFFDYIIQGHQPNIDRFCADHYVSRSTLTRKTVALRRFLATYGLKLTTTSTVFTGDEAQIRLCLHAIYWQATHGAVWPFTAIKQADIQQQIVQLPTHYGPLIQHQLMYLLAISRLRIAQDHQLPGGSLAQIAAQDYFTVESFPQLTGTQARNENQFIAWYQVGLFHFDPQTTCAEKLPVLPVPEAVAAQILAAFEVSNQPDLHALAKSKQFGQHLRQVTTCFYLLQSNYVKHSDFFSHRFKVSWIEQFNRRLRAVIAELPVTDGATVFHDEETAYCRVISFLAAHLLQNADAGRKVNVAVLLDNNDILYRRLLRFLNNQTFVRCIPADASAYDMLITEADSLLPAKAQAFARQHPDATFSWSLDVTDTDFHHLYHHLWYRYHQKLTSS